jgi:hypothetical protein
MRESYHGRRFHTAWVTSGSHEAIAHGRYVPKGGIDYLPNMPGHVASRQREIGDLDAMVL